MGTYVVRHCEQSDSFGVWDSRAGVWVEGLLSGTRAEATSDAENLNDADAAFIMEVGR